MKVNLAVILSLLIGIGIPSTFIAIGMILLLNYQNRQVLCDAINEGNTAKATRLLMNGENPNKKCEISILNPNPGYYTLRTHYTLHYPISVAIWRGNKEILQLLIKKGANVNVSNAVYDLRTRKELLPLNTSVITLCVPCAEILLENKAEPYPGGDLFGEIEAAIMHDGSSTFYESPEFKTQRYEEQERQKYRSSAVMAMLDLLLLHKLVDLDDHSRDDKFPVDNPLNSAVGSGYLSLVERLLWHGSRGPVLYSNFPYGCDSSGNPNSLYPYKEMVGLLRSNNIRVLERNDGDPSLSGNYHGVALNPNRPVCPR
jgi:hypothetical protein